MSGHDQTTPVFFHYMVGTLDDAHAEIDVRLAKQTGADAFSLNIADVTSQWALNTVNSLFKWANVHNFKLLFSFDMNGLPNPEHFIDFLRQWVRNPAYFHYQGRPLVTTFNGGAPKFDTRGLDVNQAWQFTFKNHMAASGSDVFFMPAWPDVPPSGDFFHRYPVCDGVMNWNSWPHIEQGRIDVSTHDDQTLLHAARSSGRKFRMGASPLQFKHMENNPWNNFYRRGKGNFHERVAQILQVQPDMVEFQTWNDVGEGHNMGTSWPEGIAHSHALQAYATDHTAFLEIMPTYIHAIKTGARTTEHMYPSNGRIAQGIFYYHKLLANADCPNDPFGKPRGIELVEDVVMIMLYVAPNVQELRVVAHMDGTHIGSQNLRSGYNQFVMWYGIPGNLRVEVMDVHNNVLFAGHGPSPVRAWSNLCDYNIEVAIIRPTS